MPRGYAAAPGPARAIMAGVAVNVGFYGLWRTLALLGPPPGRRNGHPASASQPDCRARHRARRCAVQPRARHRLFERGEHGLILAGFGVALVGAAEGSRKLMAVGLLAATLQVIAHAAAKSLLFVSSSAI